MYSVILAPLARLLDCSNNGVSEVGLFTEETLKLPAGYSSYIMILTGDNDIVVNDEAMRYHKALSNNGVDHIFSITKGGHDFKVWSEGLYYFSKNIFRI